MKRMEEKPIGQMGLRELRELARLRMPREAWEHFMGAQGPTEWHGYSRYSPKRSGGFS